MGESPLEVFGGLKIAAAAQGYELPFGEPQPPVAATATSEFFDQLRTTLDREGVSLPVARSGGALALYNY